MSPKKRRHSALTSPNVRETSPYRILHGDTIQYHTSFGGSLEAVSCKLNQYFEQLELTVYRDYFPAEGQHAQQGLAALRRGFRALQWRNNSLVQSQTNLSPTVWENASRRIMIKAGILKNASTLPLKQVARQSTEHHLRGFLLTFCINERVQTKVVYTPILGAWIAASKDESYQDREIKGIFCWNALPSLVQQELQLAFLLRLLIDAMWWKVPGGDPSGDSNRFVSIPIEDMVLYPIESIDLLDQMDCMSQHFDSDDRPSRHSVVRCKCVQHKDSTLNTHLLIPSNRLRQYLGELSSAKQRSTADPIFKSVLTGIPSIRVTQALQITKQRLKPVMMAQMSSIADKPKECVYQSSDEDS